MHLSRLDANSENFFVHLTPCISVSALFLSVCFGLRDSLNYFDLRKPLGYGSIARFSLYVGVKTAGIYCSVIVRSD